MNKIYFFSLILLLSAPWLKAQTVSGTVYEKENDRKVPLPTVNVHWSGSRIGTTSDVNGNFKLFKPDYYSKLVFSFVGYTSDTIEIDKLLAGLEVFLQPGTNIDQVSIVQRSQGSHLERLAPIQTERITYAELCKAACCNLAESFSTNASVDAYYANAVTGARQIRLLGLDGIYVQLLTENIPNMRGIASTYGLSYFPGPWMEGIMISKGTSSVKNGYESIAGQINVEYLKPVTADKLLLNLFLSNAGRKEANFATSVKINSKLSTLLMGHFSDDQTKEDHNGDGFLDEPLYRQFNVLNRWYYASDHIRMHAGFKLLNENRYSGQMAFSRDSIRDIDHPYGIGIMTKRAEGFFKLGYVFNNARKSSFGSINSISYHDQNSFYGIRNYQGNQLNYFLNLMYETNLVNEKHTIVSGFSFNLDNYTETLDTINSSRLERVPGVYSEYSFKPNEHFNLLAGVRLDYHNLYGLMFTPRLHARFDINGHTHFRFSAGKGYRSPMILAENNHFLANSRSIIIEPGLKQEEAWNYGLNITHYIPVGAQPMSISLEAYRTDFLEQIIVDLDSSVDQVRFSNLQGKSFSNNFQIEVGTQFIGGLDTKFAFRLTDVRYDLNQNLVEKPLVSRYKGLIVASYQTPMKKWQFDVTWQLNGPGRIPSTAGNPEAFRMADTFEAYQIINLQITKYFRTWEVYGGVENLTDFRQMHAVISGDQPFGEYFDSSIIWGPLHGRKIYLGFRYRIAREESK
ncbi:MAG: TonB-dependent receptor [Bacteroidia bacterium]|nr:TonB-dependent receptor [Bacteroidia bacterium]